MSQLCQNVGKEPSSLPAKLAKGVTVPFKGHSNINYLLCGMGNIGHILIYLVYSADHKA